MASVVDICNLALSFLGDEASLSAIDPPEGSAQADHCAQFYPIARNALLESHTWKFCTRRTTLALLDVDTFNWSYAYAEPNLALRIISILPSDASTLDESQEFESLAAEDGSPIIYTDLEDASVLYTVLVEDTSKFSPLLVVAMARLLASFLAGPILKGDAGRKESIAQYGLYLKARAEAIESDANQRHVKPEHTPSFIEARG